MEFLINHEVGSIERTQLFKGKYLTRICKVNEDVGLLHGFVDDEK